MRNIRNCCCACRVRDQRGRVKGRVHDSSLDIRPYYACKADLQHGKNKMTFISLRNLRDTLRPYISNEAEYRLRRGVYRLVPVARRREKSAKIVHACVWKSGSQWVRLILSDPRIYRHTGYIPYVAAHLHRVPMMVKSFQAERRAFLLAAYDVPKNVFEICGSDTPEVFFVVRDPRALLISWYDSTRFTHVPTDGVLIHRNAMSSMSDTAAFLYCADRFVEEFSPIFDGWLGALDGNRIIRFEQLTGGNGLTHWHDLLSSLGLQVPIGTLEKVLATYSVEKLAKPVTKGEVDKYAARGRRSWPNHLDRSDIELVEKKLAKWISGFGYV